MNISEKNPHEDSRPESLKKVIDNSVLQGILDLKKNIGQRIHGFFHKKTDYIQRPDEINFGKISTMLPSLKFYSLNVSGLPTEKGLILLLHSRKKEHSPKKQAELAEQYAMDIRAGAKLLEDGSPWTQFGEQGTPLFNDHSFHDIVAGRPYDQIDKEHNPMQSLLEEYFTPIALYRFGKDVSWNMTNTPCDTVKEITANELLQPGDLITFVNRGNPLFDKDIINHVLSGRTLKGENGENIIACKTGDGPVMIMPIWLAVKRALQGEVYGEMFNCGLKFATVYRAKSRIATETPTPTQENRELKA